MASALLENLTAASTLATTDLFYVKQAGARGLKATGTQLLALVGTAYVPLAGGTMTGALLAANGTKTAPGIAFAGASTSGVYWRAGTVVNFASGSKELMQFDANGQMAVSSFAFGTSTGHDFSVSSVMSKFAPDPVTSNMISLRGETGTTLQSFGVYNTFTDSSNYERLRLTGVAGTSVNITAESLGTGSANLDILLLPNGTGKVGIGTSSPLWELTVQGSGASSMALRDATGAVVLASVGGVGYWSTNTTNPIIFRVNDTEKLRLSNSGMVSFEGVTSSFPGLKRSTTILEVRIADDSAYTDLKLRNLICNPVAFASLVAAATAGNGAHSHINNCSHSTFGTAADGGGAVSVPVWSNGTSWLVG